MSRSAHSRSNWSLHAGVLSKPIARRDELHKSLTSSSNRPKSGTRVTRPSGAGGFGFFRQHGLASAAAMNGHWIYHHNYGLYDNS